MLQIKINNQNTHHTSPTMVDIILKFNIFLKGNGVLEEFLSI